MSDVSKIFSGVLLWVGVITGLHFSLNFDWSVALNDRKPEGERKFNVAYIPVT